MDIPQLAAAVAQYGSVGKPAWGAPLLFVGAATLIVAGIRFFIECGERRRRRLYYWSGFLVGSALIAVAVSWRGWGVSLGMFATGAFIAILFAFFYDGSLLKFGDRQISYVPPKQIQHDASEPARPNSPNTNLARFRLSGITGGSSLSAAWLLLGIYPIGWAVQFSGLRRICRHLCRRIRLAGRVRWLAHRARPESSVRHSERGLGDDVRGPVDRLPRRILHRQEMRTPAWRQTRCDSAQHRKVN